MLGLHDDHKQIPRTRDENRGWRRAVQEEARGKPEVQKRHIQACARDILYYINGFIIQFNPNAIGQGSLEVGSFITWDIQERALLKVPGVPWTPDDQRPQEAGIIWSIENRRDLLIEKSRELGASWLCLLVMDWFCRFHRYKKFLCISRNEESVESLDPDSLFWKLDFAHRHLPEWMRGTRRRRKRYIGYTDKHSFITGQATTDRAGVGGRCTAMFVDEFAQIREAYEINRRTANTTRCRIFNSTHKGSDTCFAAMVDSSERLGKPHKLVMHWSHHPDKRRGLYKFDGMTGKVEVIDKQYAYPPDFDFVMNEEPSGGPYPRLRSPWYDEMCEAMLNDRRAIGEDLDIDITGSVSAFFDGRLLARLNAEYVRSPFWEGDVSYDPETGDFLGIAERKDGPLKLWCYPRADGTLPEDDYGMGGDISTGVGATNSCFAATRASTGEQILEYATCTMKPEALARVACAIGWMMKNRYGQPAYFGWEHQGPGQTFGEKVMELKYPRVLMREVKWGNVRLHPKPTTAPGWYPSNDNKLSLLSNYRAALDKREVITHSERTLKECRDYRYAASGWVKHPLDDTGEDPTGARINHGDRVIAAALSWLVVEELRVGVPKRPDMNGHQELSPVSLAYRRQQADNERKDREDWA